MHGRPLLLLVLLLLLLAIVEPRLLLLMTLILVRCSASGWMCRGVLFRPGRKLVG
jgi:hypothetical protein